MHDLSLLVLPILLAMDAAVFRMDWRRFAGTAAVPLLFAVFWFATDRFYLGALFTSAFLIVKVMGDKSILLQTANESLTIPRNEIASQRLTELSMMPEGLLAPLSDQEVRDLIYYLSRPGQAPLPKTTAANK